jgi:hypothetical protein
MLMLALACNPPIVPQPGIADSGNVDSGEEDTGQADGFRVVDGDGVPVADARVTFLWNLDYVAITDADGVFAPPDLEVLPSPAPGQYVVQLFSEHADLELPFPIDAGPTDIVVRESSSRDIPETPAVVELDGLSLTLSAGQMDGFGLPDAIEFARMELTDLDAFAAAPDGTPVAAWAVGPLGAEATAPWPLTLDVDVPDGSYTLHQGDYMAWEGGGWTEVGRMERVDGAFVSPITADRLSTFVLVQL